MDIVEIGQSAYDSHIEGLTGLLHACVHAGASVNFILPFPEEEARAFWTGRVARAMRTGKRRLWAGVEEGRVASCVMLDWDLTPNQSHRCEVTKLLVHPGFRRRGLAAALMSRLLDGAREEGKTLVTLDTVPGTAAQFVYERAGFAMAGIIPAFARHPIEDRLEPTAYMYREL